MKRASIIMGLVLLLIGIGCFSETVSAEKTLSSQYCILDLESWDRFDSETNHYSTPEDFLREFDERVRKISDFLQVNPPEFKFRVSFELRTDSIYRFPIIEFNGILLWNDWLPLEHEITHGLVQEAKRSSLDEGLSCYIQNLFGYKADSSTCGLPVYSYVKQYIDICDPEIIEGIVNGSIDYHRLSSDENNFFYIFSHSFVKYLIETYGIEAFMDCFRNGYTPYENTAIHKTGDELKKEWLTCLHEAPDLDIPKLAEEGNEYARLYLQILESEGN